MKRFMVNGQRTKNLFNPVSDEPFKLSRSKLELFTECPRCFYLDRRLGVSRPQGPGFTLNAAVDHLLKKEFDVHRAAGSIHPLMKAYGVEAVPFQHEMLNEWRENFKGVQYLDRDNNLIITGAVDDVWINSKKELMVVDYKATSINGEITLENEYRQSYKRQMEIYQWLLRRNGFTVSDTGYFVYANGRKDKEAFDANLEFRVEIIPYKGNDHWVQATVAAAKECLMGDLPARKEDCDYCAYRAAAGRYEKSE